MRPSPDSFLHYLWRRKLLVLVTGAVCALATLAGSRWVPNQYRSEAMIMVVPARVPENMVPAMFALTKLQDRLPAIQQQVLSRTRLERIIIDLKLYEAERRTGIMEDIVERLRSSVEVTVIRGDAFRVAFIGPDPRTVMRVTDRIASLLMEESTRDREVFIEGTDQFLETQLSELATRLVAQERRLAVARSQNSKDLTVIGMEYEMLQTQYRSLFTKKEEMNVSANLERRQVGQQFKLLDQARLPIRPFSPNRPQMTIIGGLVGLGLGLAFVFIAYFRRMSSGGLAPDPLEEPAAS